MLLSLTSCLASALCLLRERLRAAVVLALLAVLARETALLWFMACLTLGARRRFARRALLGVVGAGAALAALLVLASPRMRQLLAFSFADPAAADSARQLEHLRAANG